MARFIEIEDSIINVERIESITMPTDGTGPFEIEIHLIGGEDPLVWSYDSLPEAEAIMQEIRAGITFATPPLK